MSRILVVEDEARIASFLHRALTSCGFEVVCAPNGQAALEACEREPYDLVLLDLLLPGLDGTPRSLASLKGHVVLLYFWATW